MAEGTSDVKSFNRREFFKQAALLLAIFCTTATARGAEDSQAANVWDMGELSGPPKVYPAPQVKSKHPGIRGLFYEGEPYEGKPTRVFAWYGAPQGASAKNKVPAVVCVHGGGGTAFEAWVALWNKRGCAAIAMDLEGRMPSDGGRGKAGHEHSGPAQAGIFGDISKPVKDQWMYHAVAAVVRAHSLVRSFPEVDAERTGLTGISWGGIVTCNVVGVDGRFKFAAPVYGCGFLFEAGNQYQQAYEKMSEDDRAKCRRLWDGSSHLPRAKMPMLWVNGTNDGHFPMDVFQKSYRAAAAARTLCIRVRMPHGHGAGWAPAEIYAFADSIFKGGPPLIRITDHGRDGRQAWVAFDPKTPAAGAALNFTTDSGPWSARKWQSRPARIDAEATRASAEVPQSATAYFFALTDERGLLVSSEHVETAQDAQAPAEAEARTGPPSAIPDGQAKQD